MLRRFQTLQIRKKIPGNTWFPGISCSVSFLVLNYLFEDCAVLFSGILTIHNKFTTNGILRKKKPLESVDFPRVSVTC